MQRVVPSICFHLDFPDDVFETDKLLKLFFRLEWFHVKDGGALYVEGRMDMSNGSVVFRNGSAMWGGCLFVGQRPLQKIGILGPICDAKRSSKQADKEATLGQNPLRQPLVGGLPTSIHTVSIPTGARILSIMAKALHGWWAAPLRALRRGRAGRCPVAMRMRERCVFGRGQTFGRCFSADIYPLRRETERKAAVSDLSLAPQEGMEPSRHQSSPTCAPCK